MKYNKFNWRELGYTYASPEYHRLWRQVNNTHSREWHRAYDKRMYKENYEREADRRLRYINKYPDRIKANKIIKAALASGKLIKQPCSICNQAKSIAHHDDWNKPLAVIWLCELHHKERHRNLST